MKILPQLKNKKILLLGLGKEGLSTYNFLRKRFPGTELALADSLTYGELAKTSRDLFAADKHLKLIFGTDYLSKSTGFDVVFASPGISPEIINRIAGRRTVVSSNLELFFELCSGITIGVSGTKGKSTTASLIYEVLKAGGLPAVLAGNIGDPALTALENSAENSLFVLELSSYQLLRLKQSPNYAVMQNIAPEHLDYHGSYANYVRAKENIVKFQNGKDYVIFNSLSPQAVKIAQKSRAKKIPFAAYTQDYENSILPAKSIPVRGDFNLINVIPSIIIGRLLGVSDVKITWAIKNFKPLEHRLEYVETVGGVEYYNDSLSTIPEAAIAALDTFSGKNIILLLGGFDRGLNFSGLAKAVRKVKIKGVILFPTTGRRIWEEIKGQFADKKRVPQHIFAIGMKKAVQQAAKWAGNGDIVLMSPASPSFSVFRDYKDRGDQFKKEVRNLIKKL